MLQSARENGISKFMGTMIRRAVAGMFPQGLAGNWSLQCLTGELLCQQTTAVRTYRVLSIGHKMFD